jgi:hypothetical protein
LHWHTSRKTDALPGSGPNAPRQTAAQVIPQTVVVVAAGAAVASIGDSVGIGATRDCRCVRVGV